MKRNATQEYVLGITATSRNVHAVLVKDTEAGPVIVRQFHRTVGETHSFAPLTPEAVSSESSDVSFNVGGNTTGSNPLFLAGEFGRSESGGSFDGSVGIGGDPTAIYKTTTKFDLELLDIISECQEAGFEDFCVAFAIGSAFLKTSEIKSRQGQNGNSENAKEGKLNLLSFGKGKGGKQSVESVFAEKHDGEYDPGKVVFLPMKSGDPGVSKALAVFAVSHEPVEPTLQAIRDRKRHIPPIDLLDTEITLFLGLARAAQLRSSEYGSDSSQVGPTLLVRAGTEDTIVMFIDGEELVRFESLRSITAFDPPETICSRVLLLQDEFGMGDASTVVLLGEEREDSLADSFRTFFPDTRVELLRDYLPELRSDDGNRVRGDAVLAAAVTLRILGDSVSKSQFLKVNFLPRKLLRSQFKMPFAWPLAAMYALLFVTSLFFMYRYYSQKHELELYKYELAQYPKELTSANASDLQARIDSLQVKTVGLVDALDVLDSLLIGSDRWSRALSKTASITADVPGIWIESWREDGDGLKLTGTATDRESVVSFAIQAGATIETLEFSDIRDFPVYSFTMRMQSVQELPNVARYFRDNVQLESSTLRSSD